jgi:hypothetical protein
MQEGSMSGVEGADRLHAILAAGGSVSAHQVAEGESDAARGVEGGSSSSAAAPQLLAYDIGSGVDPTPAEYAAMSAKQIVALDALRPGVAERVAQREAWAQLNESEHAVAVAQHEASAYEERMATDREFYEAEMQRHGRESLDARWWNLSPEDRAMEAASAGITAEDFAKLAAEKDARAASDVAESRSLGGPA